MKNLEFIAAANFEIIIIFTFFFWVMVYAFVRSNPEYKRFPLGAAIVFLFVGVNRSWWFFANIDEADGEWVFTWSTHWWWFNIISAQAMVFGTSLMAYPILHKYLTKWWWVPVALISGISFYIGLFIHNYQTARII